MAETVTLFGDALWESPYVFSAWVALKEKGVPFEHRVLSLQKGEHRTGEYPSRSITGRIPALQHGDFWLSESSAIGEYLEEVFPPPRHPRLYPEGARERARARQVQAWLRSDLLALRQERPTSTLFHPEKASKPLGPEAQKVVDRFLRACGELLPRGAVYLFGSFTIPDADLALMLQRLVANGDPVPEPLAAYARGIWARKAIQEWVRQPRPPR
jgi:glutathione S-transferase